MYVCRLECDERFVPLAGIDSLTRSAIVALSMSANGTNRSSSSDGKRQAGRGCRGLQVYKSAPGWGQQWSRPNFRLRISLRLRQIAHRLRGRHLTMAKGAHALPCWIALVGPRRSQASGRATRSGLVRLADCCRALRRSPRPSLLAVTHSSLILAPRFSDDFCVLTRCTRAKVDTT